jgi:signal transduction histidine kinase
MLSVVKLSLSAMPLEKDHPAYELSQHSAKVLNKAIFDLSDLTKSLHTDRITDVGLVESIKYELATIKNAGLLQVQFAQSGTEIFLPEQKAIFIFRMFQEILNNILKHSKASLVRVKISYVPDDNFALEVEDDGIGFDVSAKQQSHASSGGVGLKSMFNRARLIGANFKIISEDGKGTHILIKLPITNE